MLLWILCSADVTAGKSHSSPSRADNLSQCRAEFTHHPLLPSLHFPLSNLSFLFFLSPSLSYPQIPTLLPPSFPPSPRLPLPDLDLLPQRNISTQGVEAAGPKWEKKTGKWGTNVCMRNEEERTRWVWNGKGRWGGTSGYTEGDQWEQLTASSHFSPSLFPCKPFFLFASEEPSQPLLEDSFSCDCRCSEMERVQF